MKINKLLVHYKAIFHFGFVTIIKAYSGCHMPWFSNKKNHLQRLRDVRAHYINDWNSKQTE
jgi:hypothetical protein